MVNVPFVSEEFQRAFRNTFQGQVNTGRDLHVSDVVIPVVDFTPTASGASLPTTLQYAKNLNTSFGTYATSQSGTDIYTNSGFILLKTAFSVQGGAGFATSQFWLKDKSSSDFAVVQNYRSDTTSSSAYTVTQEDVVFIPSNYKIILYHDPNTVSVASINFSITLIADVNGNLVNPSKYDPQ